MAIFFALLLACCGTVFSQAPHLCRVLEPCSDPADIAIVVDSSGSVTDGSFVIARKFVQDLVIRFPRGPETVRFGVIYFDTNLQPIFNFNDYDAYVDAASIRAALVDRNKKGGATQIHLALDHVRDVMFTAANGDREGVLNIVIVLTDGRPTYLGSAAEAYDNLHMTGAQVIAIGIGKAEIEQLNLLASNPANVFQVDSFNALPSIQAAIGNRTCELPGIVNPCDDMLDIVFILDTSSSIHQSGPVGAFETAKVFTVNVSMHFELGPSNVQIGLAVFSHIFTPVFNVSTYSNHTQLAAAIRRAPFYSSNTRIDFALDQVREMFTPKMGGRASAKKIIILLSDGRPTYEDLALAAALRTKELGHRIISIGVASVYLPSLASLASAPSDAISVYGIEALPYIQNTLTQLTCPTFEDCTQVCNLAADIIFVLDASQNASGQPLSSLSYDYVRNFAVDITERYSLGANAARFGAVVFSTTPRKIFDLNAHSNYNTLATAIRGAPYLGGRPNIGRAISFITQANMFSSANGGRTQATQIVVLVTHSSITEQDKTFFTSLKNNGTLVVAVGVGDVYKDAMKEAVSGQDDLFLVDGFYALEYLQEPAGERVCDMPKIEQRCLVQADIIFIIDSSNRVNTTEFTAALEFAAELSTQFKLGPQNTQVGLVTFGRGNNYETVFQLGTHTSPSKVTEAFTSTSYTGGDASIISALTETLDYGLFGHFKGGRYSVLRQGTAKDILIIMSNGQTDYPEIAQRQLKGAREDQIRVITIALGQNPNSARLGQWADDNDNFAEANTATIDSVLQSFDGCMRTDIP